MEKTKKVGIIGMGRMGHCLAQGMIESKNFSADQIGFTAKHPETVEKASKTLGVEAFSSNTDLVNGSETVVLAVKPQSVEGVLSEVGKHFKKTQTVISIAAGVSTERISQHLHESVPVVRTMPNTPVFVREGITAACLGLAAGERDWERTCALFEPLGKLVKVDEAHMDAVTGLSGCGPAYIYVVLESLTEGGIKVGLPRDLASVLASQTVLGAARMLQVTGKHPAALKDEVTTPAGCTIDGLTELEEGKLRVTLMKAVSSATKRSRSLAKKAKS